MRLRPGRGMRNRLSRARAPFRSNFEVGGKNQLKSHMLKLINKWQALEENELLAICFRECAAPPLKFRVILPLSGSAAVPPESGAGQCAVL